MSRRQELATSVLAMAKSRGLTIATAESCTGGWIGKSLTDPAGASCVYAGGAVTYSNAAKMRMLGVPKAAFEDGAVSEPVALAMADGIRSALKTSMAISVTGIAGPAGGSADKPVGTVWFALAQDGMPTIARLQMLKDKGRDSVRKQAVVYALEWLNTALTQA
ncbi:MAG: CinA family protein [Robiginitomaculum sp.]